jgi:hypothetical protein
MAVGLGSMDMPVPSVAEWEWLNWKFPRPVRAGETIYARWTLTQKRAPVGGSPTAIVVWRVDVLNAGGALCAEGEVGASVTRNGSPGRPHVDQLAAPTATTSPTAAQAPRRGRRRRRTPAEGTPKPAETKVAPAEAPIVATTPAAAPERSASGTRRRRRRRSPASAQARNGDGPAPTPPAAEAASPPPAVQASAKSAKPENANTLSRVIRRLRRP